MTHGNQTAEIDRTDQNFLPEEDLTGPLASVGISLSTGASTEYAREKYEISAWCTLPCRPNEAAIIETYRVAYTFCKNEIQRRRDEVEADAFPGHRRQS